MNFNKSASLLFRLFISLVIISVIQTVWIGPIDVLAAKTKSHPPKIIKKAQATLKAKGYKPGPADGIWGKMTSNAVTQFQKDNELKLTGKLDYKTMRALFYKPTEEYVPTYIDKRTGKPYNPKDLQPLKQEN